MCYVSELFYQNRNIYASSQTCWFQEQKTVHFSFCFQNSYYIKLSHYMSKAKSKNLMSKRQCSWTTVSHTNTRTLVTIHNYTKSVPCITFTQKKLSFIVFLIKNLIKLKKIWVTMIKLKLENIHFITQRLRLKFHRWDIYQREFKQLSEGISEKST